MSGFNRKACKVYVLDCTKLWTKDDLHDALAAALDLPDYYGRNLDALWDCLWELGSAEIVMVNPQKLVTNLGEYGQSVIDLLGEAAGENVSLTVRVVER